MSGASNGGRVRSLRDGWAIALAWASCLFGCAVIVGWLVWA